jgi:hypothetical protein
MPAYNMQDYRPVAERVSAAQPDLRSVHADQPVMLTDAMGYIRVTVLLNDDRSATGIASFRLDLAGKGAQATNPIEDCETSAVGRALAFLGYSSSKSIASREEVQEARRREAASYAPPTTNGERPLVKRLRELVADCRAAGVPVPDLPKPKEMTDEALMKAIEALEIEYAARQGSDFDQSPPARPPAPEKPVKPEPLTGQGQPAKVAGIGKRTTIVKERPGVVGDEELPL